MHPSLEEAIQAKQREVDVLKTFEEDVDSITRLLPRASIWFDHEINVSWTSESMSEVKHILRRFAEEGVFIISYEKSDTNIKWALQGKNAVIRLTPTWTMNEAAQCRLVKVGEKEVVHKQNVYKLVCDDRKELTNQEELTE